MYYAFVRWFYFTVIKLFFALFTRTRVIGLENLPPPESEPLIIVSNHFSYFEVPLLATRLPRMPTMFGAAELIENPIIGLGMKAFKDRVITVRRGVFDRGALQKAIAQLKKNRWVAIFPEGGITAETIALAMSGQSTNGIPNSFSRPEPKLLPARPGAAYMAVASHARILPISFLGTEAIGENLGRFKRTPVTMRIGRPIGPLPTLEGLHGREKRELMNQLGDQMMQAVAKLLPPENRGFYQEA